MAQTMGQSMVFDAEWDTDCGRVAMKYWRTQNECYTVHAYRNYRTDRVFVVFGMGTRDEVIFKDVTLFQIEQLVKAF